MPREHPEADLQKASPTVWEGRGSRVQLGPFDLSSYIEPGCSSGKRQTAGGYVGHGHPRVFTPASFCLEHLPSPGALSPAAFSTLLRCMAAA